jgi:hypothetical protein
VAGPVSDQQRHESPELGAFIGRMLNALIRRAAEGDWEALEALARIEALAPAAMTAGLVASRDRYSLATLGSVVQTTRQAVQQRTKSDGWKTHTPEVKGLGQCAHPTCVGMARCREGALL